MAPRGGRGGGSGGSRGSSSPTCPNAFAGIPSQVWFAQSVVFFVLFLCIAFASSGIRKKGGAGKKLLGGPFLLALFLFILAYFLDALARVLNECDTIDSFSYLNFFIANTVFWFLGYWLLLFVFIYTLNTMLQEQLGNVKAAFKFIYMAILGLMFAITAAAIGLTCYNTYYQTQYTSYYDYVDNGLLLQGQRLRMAYIVLYFLSVLASSALTVMTMMKLRSRQHPTGDLIGWIAALIFFMVFWVIIHLSLYAISLPGDNFLTFETQAALYYIESFAQFLVFVILLCIAKHAGWSKSAAAPTEVYANQPEVVYQQPVQQQPVYAHNNGAPPQQQYAYNYPNGQQPQPAYSQQAPVYYGNPGQPMK